MTESCSRFVDVLRFWPSMCGDAAAALHDGHEDDMMDFLSSLRKICKAHLCVNWTGMINADVVAIGNVSGSHQLGRVLHEVITLSNLGQRPLDSCML